MSEWESLVFKHRPLNFAHRGFTANAPENTLAAFKAAIDLGADGIELDVRTCKSGEVIVFHDPTLARMTDGRGFVKSKTLKELKELKIKSDTGITDERIPTLEEVLDLVAGRLIFNIEIKTKGLPKDHIEKKVVQILQRHGIEYRTIISSFNPLVIRRLSMIDEKLLSGFLIDKNFHVRRSEFLITKFAGAKAIHVEKGLAKDTFIAKIKEMGFRCLVWSVNEPKMMEKLAKLKVDGIITDKPDIMKNIN